MNIPVCPVVDVLIDCFFGFPNLEVYLEAGYS